MKKIFLFALFSIAIFSFGQQKDSLRIKSLDEVTITGKKGQYKIDSSMTAAKIALKDIENPQTIISISSTLLKDQLNTNFDDALNNAPGVQKLWESTGRGSDGSGYYGIRGFDVQVGLKNGLPNLGNGTPDPSNIEKIEILKGPSGTLYGGALTSHGGLIDIITKKPLSYNFANLSYSYGSFESHRATLDYNQVLDNKNKSALRINAAYTNAETFQDYGYRKSAFVAPSLLLTVNDKLSFFVNSEFMYSKGTNPTMLFMDRSSVSRYRTVKELGYDPDKSFTSNDLALENPSYNIQTQMNYKINNQWNSQTSFSANTSYSRGYYSYLYEATNTIETTLGTPIDGSIYGRYTSKQDAKTNGYDFQQNFNGDFKIGSFRNRLLIGGDYYREKKTDKSSGYGNQGFIYIGKDNSTFQAIAPILNSVYGSPYSMNNAGDDSGLLTPQGVILPAGEPNNSTLENYSGYISNIFNIADNLLINAAVRYDVYAIKSENAFETSKKTLENWSPKFGIVFQPIKDQISIFVNYQNGFQRPQQVSDYVDGTGINRYAKPEQSIQYEGGIKLDVFHNKLSATLSYFDISVNDKAMFIGDYTNGHTTQDGKQRNKGIEASVFSTPISGWNILLGYSYTDSNLTKGDVDFSGLRPESAGPFHLANFWTSYKFTKTALKGLGLGVGGNYGSKYATLNRNIKDEITGSTVNSRFYLPEYFVFNASIFYEINHFRIAAKVDNFTNEVYYKGWSTINPQNPRSFLGSISYSF